MIRILNAEPLEYSSYAQTILESIGEITAASVDHAGLLACIGNYDVLIVRLAFQIDQEVLDAAHRLRVIVTPTTGLDHIDVPYAQRRGIAVLSLQGETEFLRTITATAEYAWALLLALVRRIPWAFAAAQQGHWQRDLFRGRSLKEKRLGLVGMGRLGEQVARYARAFDMYVAAYDPYRPRDEWPSWVQRVKDIQPLLAQSDIVSLHIPLNDETVGLISEAEFSAMPIGALLINTSRGKIINETALLAALESGYLGGAAIDVICGEWMNLVDHPLLVYARTRDNLLITPHLGGATVEAMHKTEEFMAHKLVRCFSGLG